MKATLYIFSDIYGYHNAEWITHYVELLKDLFEIHLIDIRKVAHLESFEDSQLHKAYLDSQKMNLICEKISNQLISPCRVLGFSLGGTLAWKIALTNPYISSLTLVSATRIRFESIKPKCNISVFFGEKDEHKPCQNWFSKHQIFPLIIEHKSHDFYRDKANCELICSQLIMQID